MKVFDISNGSIVLDPARLIIPEFNELWKRDKTKDKMKAIKELSYIVFMYDLSVDNPYRGYLEVERNKVLKSDFFNEKWEPDKDVEKAIKKFRELTETTNTRLLSSARSAAEKLASYFEEVDFKQLDAQGKPAYSARELASNLAAVGSIVKSLSQLEEQVRKESMESSLARGGSDIGIYEIPKLDFEYGV